jgi:hypothetical protein
MSNAKLFYRSSVIFGIDRRRVSLALVLASGLAGVSKFELVDLQTILQSIIRENNLLLTVISLQALCMGRWLIPRTCFNPLVTLGNISKSWHVIASQTIDILEFWRGTEKYGRYMYHLASCDSPTDNDNWISLGML